MAKQWLDSISKKSKSYWVYNRVRHIQREILTRNYCYEAVVAKRLR
jgi:hypothetical protein